jgi:hypothetical protein
MGKESILMRSTRSLTIALCAATIVLAGCGSGDEVPSQPAGPASTAAGLAPQPRPQTSTTTAAATHASRPAAPTASGAPAAPDRSPLADRLSDPQLAADQLVDAWVRADRAAAGKLTSQAVVARLFAEDPPAAAPKALPCRLAAPGTFVCSYPLAERAELTLIVAGGASAGYRISGVQFGD